MSRDNSINIKAGGDVRIEAIAVGDGAQAAAVQSAQAEKLAEHFLQIRTSFDALETAGEITPAEAALLRTEAEEVHAVAKTALTDESQKENLVLKLKRFGGSISTFCREQKVLFEALHHVAAACAVPLGLLGLPGV